MDCADTVTYCSAAILVIFFCLQRFGTDKVSFVFSPFLLVWFASIFAIGAYNIHFYPAIFKAFNPYYIYLFFERNKREGLISLAGIVLAITGKLQRNLYFHFCKFTYFYAMDLSGMSLCNCFWKGNFKLLFGL